MPAAAEPLTQAVSWSQNEGIAAFVPIHTSDVCFLSQSVWPADWLSRAKRSHAKLSSESKPKLVPRWGERSEGLPEPPARTARCRNCGTNCHKYVRFTLRSRVSRSGSSFGGCSVRCTPAEFCRNPREIRSGIRIKKSFDLAERSRSRIPLGT